MNTIDVMSDSQFHTPQPVTGAAIETARKLGAEGAPLGLVSRHLGRYPGCRRAYFEAARQNLIDAKIPETDAVVRMLGNVAARAR